MVAIRRMDAARPSPARGVSATSCHQSVTGFGVREEVSGEINPHQPTNDAAEGDDCHKSRQARLIHT